MLDHSVAGKCGGHYKLRAYRTLTLSTWCASLCTVLLITLVAVPRDVTAISPLPQPINHSRVDILTAWLLAKGCPNDAVWFVNAADVSSIDYRTLVPIFLIESGCGKHGLYNNYFGYGSSYGLKHFASIEDSIYYISTQLATNKIYAGKTLEQKLKIYNSINPNYWNEYTKLFNSIQ